jgi:hypothetical protein
MSSAFLSPLPLRERVRGRGKADFHDVSELKKANEEADFDDISELKKATTKRLISTTCTNLSRAALPLTPALSRKGRGSKTLTPSTGRL